MKPIDLLLALACRLALFFLLLSPLSSPIAGDLPQGYQFQSILDPVV